MTRYKCDEANVLLIWEDLEEGQLELDITTT